MRGPGDELARNPRGDSFSGNRLYAQFAEYAETHRNGQYWGAKDTTEDYISIDVRRWKRDGLLTPGQYFGWQWSVNGKKTSSIRVRTETGRVILTYRHRRNGEEWQDESYPIYLD